MSPASSQSRRATLPWAGCFMWLRSQMHGLRCHMTPPKELRSSAILQPHTDDQRHQIWFATWNEYRSWSFISASVASSKCYMKYMKLFCTGLASHSGCPLPRPPCHLEQAPGTLTYVVWPFSSFFVTCAGWFIIGSQTGLPEGHGYPGRFRVLQRLTGTLKYGGGYLRRHFFRGPELWCTPLVTNINDFLCVFIKC